MITIESLQTPAFLIDVLDGDRFLYREGNAALLARTGLGQRLVAGRSPHELLPVAIAPVIIEQYRTCIQTRTAVSFEEMLDWNGEVSHWRTTIVPICRSGGHAVTAILGTVVEITAVKRQERDLLRAHAQLTLALQAVQGAHWEYDIGNHHFEASPALAVLLGEARPQRVTLEAWIDRIPAAERPRASFHGLIDGGLREQVTQFPIDTAAGERRWLKCRRLALRNEAGEAAMIFGVTTDVTDEVLREQRLTREAQHDGLTHLLNRRGFFMRLDEVIAGGAPDGASLAVLMLDLDRFKAINDTLGHAAGDAVLATVGERIADLLGPADFAARLGGDEFALGLRGLAPEGLPPVVARLRRRLSWPCAYRDQLIPVAASVGATFWAPGQAALDVTEAADQALYDEKRNRRAPAPASAPPQQQQSRRRA